jgi:ketosteroid isomerase-like protein
MNDEVAELEDFGKRWVEAELARDVIVLDAVTHKDFILVGPLGFALDKAQWLDRYANEDLVTSSLSWRDTQARVFGDCAVVIGTHDQQASYRGQPNNGQFRATHILVREDGAWRLAGMHLSPMSVPPEAQRQTE